MKKPGASRYPEINWGDLLAIKIKNSLYADIHWAKCCMEIGLRMRQLLKKMKPFYPEKDEVQLIILLADYSDADMRDAFDDLPPVKANGLTKMLERAITLQV